MGRISRAMRLESENVTYILDDGDGPSAVLRRYRPGYHTEESIRAELAFQRAARAAGMHEVPAIREDATGMTLVEHGGAWWASFEYLRGEEPGVEMLPGLAFVIGREAALLGRVGGGLGDVAASRFAWDETALGRWGRITAPGPATRAALREVQDALRATHGQRPMTLRHADLRLANLLVLEGELVGVLDFDDCGHTFAGFDFAATVSFLEEDAGLLREVAAAWRAGYETVETLGEQEWALVPHLVMLRRLTLAAWLESHPRAIVPGVDRRGFGSGTETVARRYLEGVLVG